MCGHLPITTRCGSLPDSSYYGLNGSDVNLLEGKHWWAGSSNRGTCVVQPVYEDVLQSVHSCVAKGAREIEKRALISWSLRYCDRWHRLFV